MSLYTLKPRFQALLRPLVSRLAAHGVTANQVTAAACLLSVAVAAWIAVHANQRIWFVLIPVWMFLRMAMNAVDGMLAREFGQQSNLGHYLNELTDVVSDAALYLPFALVAPFSIGAVFAVIGLAVLSEYAGVLAAGIGAPRRYDGPMGKSDRALVFGALALWIGLTEALPAWSQWLMWAVAVLLLWTTINRVRHGLAAAPPATPGSKP